MQTVSIVQIDDNKEHCERLKTLAWRLGDKRGWNVLLTDFQSLDEGYKYLIRASECKGLILDAKCVINKGETDDMEFLAVALGRLQELNTRTGRVFTPFVINTGFATFPEITSQERNIEELGGQVFDKTDERNMLDFLFDRIAELEDIAIERKYKDVFALFDNGFLDSAFRKNLLRLLQESRSEDSALIKTNLGRLRNLQEIVYQTLSTFDPKIVPSSMVQPRVTFWPISKHLSGNKRNIAAPPAKDFQPTTYVHQNKWVESLSECIYKVASDYGAHSSTESDLPSGYTVQALLFGFLEQLIWFRRIVDKEFKK